MQKIVLELRRVRAERKLSQEDLALKVQHLGGRLRPKDISQIENGKRSPRRDVLELIAEALDCEWQLNDAKRKGK